MLSSEQSIVVYKDGYALPERLHRNSHAHYLRYAEQMLAVYQCGVGQIRRDLHRSIEGIFSDEADCPSRRIHAFCKLLDDAGEYETDPHGNAAELRLRVFSLAVPSYPLTCTKGSLFGTPEREVKTRIAQELGRAWEDIEAGLYADVIEFQRLKSFKGYENPEMLLRHYNVAQAQACLYRAESISITARKDFRRILRHVKFARLMFEIRQRGSSDYHFNLTGPASVLTETRRYGILFAQLLPALLACEDWDFKAVVQTPWSTKARFCLKSTDGLRSHLPPPPEFDSEVEAAFAKKFGQKREGWTLLREAAVLNAGQMTFVPDFMFRHEDSTEVMFEIVGFWTPEYLEQKRQTIRCFSQHRILLAVPESSLTSGQQVPENVIVYKTAIKIEPVLLALKKWQKI